MRRSEICYDEKTHIIYFNNEKDELEPVILNNCKFEKNKECGWNVSLEKNFFSMDSLVISNVFRLAGTYGIPLEVILCYFKKRNLLVDWVDYIRSALKDGGKLSNIKSRILAAIGDVYGLDYRKEFELRLNILT